MREQVETGRAAHLVQADKLRERAEGYQRLAKTAGDWPTAWAYRQLARAYESLAAEEEALAAKLPE